jgi:hypothetical protein
MSLLLEGINTSVVDNEQLMLLDRFMIASAMVVSSTTELQREEDLERVDEILDGYNTWRMVQGLEFGEMV